MTVRTLDLVIRADLLDEFNDYKHLVPGREEGQEASPDGIHVTIKMALPSAPPQAVAMEPWFIRSAEGNVSLGGVTYYDAQQQRIT